MRTLIATSEVPGAALAELATDWQVEAELRCEAAGIALHWQLQGDAPLSGRQRYQLECMQRELVSNALEHGRGRHLRVAWTVAAGTLRLDIEDDGAGIADPRALGGQGIASVRSRATDLGGSAEWRRGALGGICCEVRVPLDLPPATP
jgi:signal transduction histidine kinase